MLNPNTTLGILWKNIRKHFDFPKNVTEQYLGLEEHLPMPVAKKKIKSQTQKVIKALKNTLTIDFT